MKIFTIQLHYWRIQLVFGGGKCLDYLRLRRPARSVVGSASSQAGLKQATAAAAAAAGFAGEQLLCCKCGLGKVLDL